MSESKPTSERLNVLLIEACTEISLVMRHSLERAGHHVTTCPVAEAALSFLDLSSFDLIILGYRFFPAMNGLDFLQILNQEGNTTPVIMATRYGDPRIAIQAMRGGAVDFAFMDPNLKFLFELPERAHRAVMRFRCRGGVTPD
jgi:DNA-binding NtrC family response regulator